MNYTDTRMQNTSNSNSNKESDHRYLILVAVVVIFFIILFITMDLNKDHAITSNSSYSRKPWIHEKNSIYHYGIVLDCGSSGTRVFIYYWPDHNGNPDHLLNIHQMMDRDGQPVRLKVRPGKN